MGFFKGVKSAASVVFGARTLKQQASYVREDMARFKQDLSVANPLKKQSERRVDEWKTFINRHGINTSQLKNQYRVRRGISALLLMVLFICFYFIVVRGHYNVGTACFLIAGLLYFRNNFRLYQIRHRQLCTMSSFLKQANVAFRECLPLKLPNTWQVLDEAEGSSAEVSE